MTEENRSSEVPKPIRVDPRFKHEVLQAPGGEALKVCFQCGVCTACCPVARFSGSYRPREIIHMAQLGLKKRVLSSDTLWLCAACYTCTDRCPQGVEPASVIRVLRNLAVKKGNIPAVFRQQASNVLETGYTFKITAARQKKREKQGLPPLPKAKKEDLKKLAEATGLSKKLEEKGE